MNRNSRAYHCSPTNAGALVRSALLLVATTALAACGALRPGDEAEALRLASDRPAVCRVAAPETFQLATGRETAMTTTNEGLWCGFYLNHVSGVAASLSPPGPDSPSARRFDTHLMVEAPTNGEVRLFTSSNRSLVMYRASPGYDGPDSFTLRLFPGGGFYPVAVNAIPVLDGAPPVGRVLFETDRAVLRAEWRLILDGFLADLRVVTRVEAGQTPRLPPGTNLRIAGFADPRGGQGYNFELAMRRAAAVRDYIVERSGIDASRVLVESFGMTRPIDTRFPAAPVNRRVEVFLEGGAAGTPGQATAANDRAVNRTASIR